MVVDACRNVVDQDTYLKKHTWVLKVAFSFVQSHCRIGLICHKTPAKIVKVRILQKEIHLVKGGRDHSLIRVQRHGPRGRHSTGYD